LIDALRARTRSLSIGSIVKSRMGLSARDLSSTRMMLFSVLLDGFYLEGPLSSDANACEAPAPLPNKVMFEVDGGVGLPMGVVLHPISAFVKGVMH
jgi:hypothetical protein